MTPRDPLRPSSGAPGRPPGLGRGVAAILLAAGVAAAAGAGLELSFGLKGAPAAAAPAYLVTFRESGLPVETVWWVKVAGEPEKFGSGATFSFNLSDGAYDFGVGTSDREYRGHGGTFSVEGGGRQIPLAFSAVKYIIAFNETGLPTSTNWAVSLGGGTANSTSPTVVFVEFNGSYGFTVVLANFSASPSSGVINVDGSNVSQTISFQPLPGPGSARSSDPVPRAEPSLRTG